jgi:rsbT co-antagonist protein RsbR
MLEGSITFRSWRIMSLLMVFFVAGYLAAAVFLWIGLRDILAMITGAVFFFGALFVYLVVRVGRSTVEELRQQTLTLEEHREKLQVFYEEEVRLQQEAIANKLSAIEFSTPVIPVAEGILAMPLIGTIDSERARRIIKTLLREVSRNRARTVIIDITGVSALDPDVAQSLLKAALGVQLLGAEPLLTGLDAKSAQTIAGSGLDFSGLVIRATLAEGLAYAMQAEG